MDRQPRETRTYQDAIIEANHRTFSPYGYYCKLCKRTGWCKCQPKGD